MHNVCKGIPKNKATIILPLSLFVKYLFDKKRINNNAKYFIFGILKCHSFVDFCLCRYVFISQKAYQETEDRPDSSVYTEMRGVAMLEDNIQDTTEYVQPSEVRKHYSVLKIQSYSLSHTKKANAYCKKKFNLLTFCGHIRFTAYCKAHLYSKHFFTVYFHNMKFCAGW